MIVAVRPKMEADAERLRGLLDESREKMKPLGDPLDLDVGLHRWLNAEREEAYSDWLEWVVSQAKTAARIYRLFGSKPLPQMPDDAKLDLKREVRVAPRRAVGPRRLPC
jgi:hypothetical protein